MSSSLPPELDPPWSRVRRGGIGYLASFEANRNEHPLPHREAHQVRTVNLAASSHVELERARFAAFGWRPFTKDEFYRHGELPDVPSDLARYKTRVGTGVLKTVGSGLTKVELGTSTYAGYVKSAGHWVVSTPTYGDATYSFTDDGESFPGHPCDEGSWANQAGPFYDFPIIPSFYYSLPFGTPNDAWWHASSSTEVGKNPDWEEDGSVCPDSNATMTLTDKCVWDDLVSESNKVLVEGYDSSVSDGYTPAIAWNTGDGASDGTLYMTKTRGRYRFSAAPYRRLIRWREVTRKNNANVEPELIRRATELSGPIAKPYYDEFGAWSPSDLSWEDVMERTINWAHAHGVNGQLPLILCGWASLGNDEPLHWEGIVVIYATKLRFYVETEESAAVQIRATIWDGAETSTVTLDVVDRVSAELDFVLAGEEGTDVRELHVVEVLVAGEVRSDIVAKVCFRQRRRIKTAGHPARDGSDSFWSPHRYRVQTETSEWGMNCVNGRGGDWDAGRRFQTPCVGTARLVTEKAYNLTNGEPEWDIFSSNTLGIMRDRVGTFAGVRWLPLRHGDSAGVIEWILTGPVQEDATTLIFERPLPATDQLMVPVDANVPAMYFAYSTPTLIDDGDLRGELVSSVNQSEIVEAGEPSAWRVVDCSMRGAAVTLELLSAIRI